MSVSSPPTYGLLPMATHYRRAWLIFLAVCLLVAVVKIYLNVKLRYDRSQHQTVMSARQQAAVKMPHVIPELLREKKNWTKAEVEERLNGGRPFASTLDRDGAEVVSWTNPQSQMRWSLIFRKGRWDGYSGFNYVGSTPPPQPTALYAAMEEARLQYVHFATPIWVALFVLTIATWRIMPVSWPLANVLLGTAMVAFLGWLLSPGYASFRGIFTNGNLFWCLLLIGISAVVRWCRSQVPDPAARGLCPVCEYDLHGDESGVCPECGTPIQA